eukprot:Plantae.Rhodophyta-Hildenbrandia_rubra.ctg2060.p2 GENE.Plantae.Rhodophyta-Hildenbrandia_rubra.ctg2060~~Plantae.Rhodophyta-Hildenbrandia_rubra.ctg2060.p2  ORF type:complete len:435 (+),score=74.42 Plantae.Rhodophyta-Hildenbrandia_rubra.ctg2060:3473-4777(+)
MLSINIFANLGWRVGEWWPGIVLSILGAIFNNLGTNIMKLSINLRLLLPPEERPRLSAMPKWLGGFALFVLGTAMSFGAFKFAAQSLLSGLGSVQFLSQVVFSKYVLHEKIEKYAYFGVGLIVVGCTFLVIFGAHDTKNYKPEELAALYGRSEYVCYFLGAGFLACVVSVAYRMMKQRIMRANGMSRFDMKRASIRERQILAVFFSIRSGIFGSQAVLLAKSLSMLLIQLLHPTPSYSNPLRSYQTYFIILGFIAAAIYWVTRLNHGLRLFEAVYLIPMMQICWIFFSTIAGGIYYEEFSGFGEKEYGAYALGFLCVLIGVAMLCPKDDAKPLNAAEVLYEIVSEENPLVSPRAPAHLVHPSERFTVGGDEEEGLAAQPTSNGLDKRKAALERSMTNEDEYAQESDNLVHSSPEWNSTDRRSEVPTKEADLGAV